MDEPDTALAKPPEICASRSLINNAPILIRRGVAGFKYANPTLDPDAYNAQHGVTKAQEKAMWIGSLVGWD